MTELFPSSDCDQAREAASARLDGELSELEVVRLEAHLDGCESCRAVVFGFSGTATLIRQTPSEAPGRPFVLPSRRLARRRSLSLQTAVAASALLAAASFSLGRALHPRSSPPRRTSTGLTATAAASDHLLALLPENRLSASHMIRLGRNLPV